MTASLNLELEERGFILLPDFIDSETVDALAYAVDRELHRNSDHARNGVAYALRNLLSVPEVREFATSAPVKYFLSEVFGEDAFAVRGILFDKTSAANWKVPWHQDLTIPVCERIDCADFGPWSVKDNVTHVQPPVAVLEEMLTLRLHLDDCALDNGPLEVLPGSHRESRLDHTAIEQWREREYPISCVTLRGGVVAMRPLLLHSSRPAKNPRRRRIIHLEFAVDPLPGGLKWHQTI